MINTRKGPLYDPGICRCCGAIKKCRLLNTEYEWQGQKEIYSDMFVDCFGLLLSNLDGEAEERLVCATCVSRLREACSFRQQVLQCEEKLLTTKIHGDGIELNNEVKIESNVKEEDDINLKLDDNDNTDHIDNDDDLEDTKMELRSKPKRKLSRQKLKVGKKRKTRKKSQEDDIISREMVFEAQSISEKLKELEDVEIPPPTNQRLNGCKYHENIVTIVENSFACPFDTSFSDYFCVYCREVFTDPDKLREHTMTHDPTTYKDVIQNYNSNKKVQIDIFRIDCRLCPTNVQDMDSFKDHITNIHGLTLNSDSNYLKFRLTQGRLSCTECDSSFSFFHALKKHMAKHFGTCICDVCGAHYFDERMLLIHQKTHQRIQESFTCKECGKTFKSNYSRYIHIARTHKKEATYLCSKCDEVFFSYSLRYRHMIEVHGVERLFHCEQCGRTYNSRKSLREHCRRLHLKIMKHQCDLCDKRFYLPSRLKEHMASHTGERNFRCEYCGKSYPMLRGLKIHMQSHSSEKRFKCTLCSASFTQNVNLKNHVKRHHQSMDLEEYRE